MQIDVTCISDTHGVHDQLDLPGGDLLLHCGDFSLKETAMEYAQFMEWFSKQDYEHKVYIAGNHDTIAEGRCLVDFVGKMYPNVHYLQDTSITLFGMKIHGTPWTPEFGRTKAFMLPRGGDRLHSKRKAIPEDTEILLTHGPPLGILDYTDRAGRNLGCNLLMTKVLYRMPKLRLHAFGHIHAPGADIGHYFDEPTFINASVVAEAKMKVVEKMGTSFRLETK